MLRVLSLENLTVTRKLGLGFGLLLALAVLLAGTGLKGLRNDEQSFERISRLGALFDETVYAREANFQYALSADKAHLGSHAEHQLTLKQALAQLLEDVQGNQWPVDDLPTVQQLNADLDRYNQAHQAAQAALPADAKAIVQANERLSALQDNINVLYKKEEERAATSVGTVVSILLGVTAVALVLGVLIAWLIGRQIVRPLRQTLDAAERIAQGDLTVQLDSHRNDELGQLLRAIGHMSQRLRDVITQIGHGSSQLAVSASQLATITTQTQAGTDSQKTDTDRVATAMNEMTSMVQAVARNSEDAATAARLADQEASGASGISRNAIVQIEALAGEVGVSADSMNRLHKEIDRIASVLGVIKAVAGQTNLLALNAAIEAARAGEAGRGFAVVADEVRSLAQRTQQSSEEIEQLIGELQRIANESTQIMQSSVEQTQSTVTGVRNTGDALAVITRQVSEIQQMSLRIASAAEEQTGVVEEITRSVLHVRETADQSALASSEIATSSVELARLGNDLQSLVVHFRT
ncbi:methyl-accepting chemotaxis protein [Pseudomonas sp. MAFF212428]|uniref:Methyl-accepting chemotaxis protein n=2 Tax=Pseudomonas brassicae TaxID=2708063 RepID=A0A6B3NV86_9PSED|nr:methyl-accepting chemotaxis protein [Pseudomonas brassicae]NER60245.1 methyl-accepting chemotaxis protein [Pseudomonas brassicae]NER64170.1 methyl-accepting chemotaxis protein [Pseudomonas brassicae]